MPSKLDEIEIRVKHFVSKIKHTVVFTFCKRTVVNREGSSLAQKSELGGTELIVKEDGE